MPVVSESLPFEGITMAPRPSGSLAVNEFDRMGQASTPAPDLDDREGMFEREITNMPRWPSLAHP